VCPKKPPKSSNLTKDNENMTDYRVNLDIFAGPMDLLLYLVRKEEVDIYDIPITRITDQYLQYIEMLKSLDIDLAGSFLVMAATLMQIKSAMLLPRAEPEYSDDGDLADPRAELIRQLLEYKKFKDAANMLDSAAQEAKNRYSRPDIIIQKLKPDAEPELDMEQVSVWDLLEAFDVICRATGTTYQIKHITDETPIDLYQIEVLAQLQAEGPLLFETIFASKPNRLVMIGLFLAVLELIRDGLVSVKYIAASSSFQIKALTDEPAEQAVQKAIAASDGQSGAAIDKTGWQQTKLSAAEQKPPIPVVELPAKKAHKQKDYEKVELTGENEQQTSN
jgi:segregation and condensation protein A